MTFFVFLLQFVINKFEDKLMNYPNSQKIKNFVQIHAPTYVPATQFQDSAQYFFMSIPAATRRALVKFI